MTQKYSSSYYPLISSPRLFDACIVICDAHLHKLLQPWHSWSHRATPTLRRRHYLPYIERQPLLAHNIPSYAMHRTQVYFLFTFLQMVSLK